MNRMTKILILCVFLLSTLTGCFNDNLVAQREKNAGKGDYITIGVPVPMAFAEENTNFLKGIKLAEEDTNIKGINGKKIKLEIVDDQGNFKTAVDIAQEFSENTRMIAVIGHWFSDICIPISTIYEDAGMLTVVPTVSNPDLTKKKHQYIFQNITNDRKITEEMCAYAKRNNYQRVVIYYEESSYGENLANAIEDRAMKIGIKIVDRSSGLVTEEQFKKAHDKWKALEYDAVLLALNMPEGGIFISEIRNIGSEAGIISADGLDVGNFIDILGEDAEGVVMITTYNPDNYSLQLKQFTKKYQTKYNEQPDVWAILGYESVQIIAQAIQQTNGYSPAVLADYLRQTEPWETVSGAISFNNNGEIEGREIYKKIVVDGQFKYID